VIGRSFTRVVPSSSHDITSYCVSAFLPVSWQTFCFGRLG